MPNSMLRMKVWTVDFPLSFSPADELNPIGKFQCAVLHFSKIADFQFFYFIFYASRNLFSAVPACRQQRLETIVERLL